MPKRHAYHFQAGSNNTFVVDELPEGAGGPTWGSTPFATPYAVPPGTRMELVRGDEAIVAKHRSVGVIIIVVALCLFGMFWVRYHYTWGGGNSDQLYTQQMNTRANIASSETERDMEVAQSQANAQVAIAEQARADADAERVRLAAQRENAQAAINAANVRAFQAEQDRAASAEQARQEAERDREAAESRLASQRSTTVSNNFAPAPQHVTFSVVNPTAGIQPQYQQRLQTGYSVVVGGPQYYRPMHRHHCWIVRTPFGLRKECR